MASSSSTCTNNNRRLGAPASVSCILDAAGALSLLSIVYLLSIVTNSSNGDAYAQQYNAPPQPTTHSSLIQKTIQQYHQTIIFCLTQEQQQLK